MTAVRERTTTRRLHGDSPGTEADFERLAELPAGPERDTLVEDLTETWLPMAQRLARRFRNRGENLQDLQQVAALGLLKAVERYDPARGTPFEPYAVPKIIGEVKRHFRDHGWDLHVPRRIQELRNKVRASIQELSTGQGQGAPTVARIGEHAGLSPEDVLAGMEALESFRALSLEADINPGEGSYSLADTIGHSESRYDTVIDREAVKPALALLPEREKNILNLRFFHDMTQSSIAEELGVSQMHVSRLITRACKQVRSQVEHDEAPAEPMPLTA